MKKFKVTTMFLALIMALIIMPSSVFAAADCNAVATENDLRACLEAGESVKLTSDIEVTTSTTNTPTTGRTVGINIAGDGEIVIDGNGYTISTSAVRVLFEVRATAADTEVKFVNVTLDSQNQGYARVIDTRSNNLELSLEGVTITAGGAGNPQGITIGGPNGPVKLNIKDTTIDVGYAGYGIITFNTAIVSIEDSVIEGYAALYLKGPDGSIGSSNSEINVADSKLIGKNNTNGDTNTFGVIVFEDSNIEVNIESSEIKANSTGDQYEVPFVFGDSYTPDADIYVNVTGNSKIEVNNDQADDLLILEENEFWNVTVGAGVQTNVEIDEEFIEEGSKAVETENGIVIAKENTITVLTSENGTITVNKTKAYLNDVVTVTVTPKEGYKVKLVGVETAAGSKVELVDGKFTMPNSAVVVGATYEKIETIVVEPEAPVENPETGDMNVVAIMSMLTLGLVGLGYTVKKRFN